MGIILILIFLSSRISAETTSISTVTTVTNIIQITDAAFIRYTSNDDIWSATVCPASRYVIQFHTRTLALTSGQCMAPKLSLGRCCPTSITAACEMCTACQDQSVIVANGRHTICRTALISQDINDFNPLTYISGGTANWTVLRTPPQLPSTP
jgi:hypothetical protein